VFHDVKMCFLDLQNTWHFEMIVSVYLYANTQSSNVHRLNMSICALQGRQAQAALSLTLPQNENTLHAKPLLTANIEEDDDTSDN